MSNIRPILRPILRNSLFSSSALALSLVTSAPLLAAEHGENDNLAENANNAEQPESEPNMVIVTGEKLDRTLEETTTSVVIYSGEELERRSIDDLYDVVLRTPNVTQSFGEKGFAIRGIDQRFGGGAGLLVNTIVDGASLPNNQSTFFGPYSAWDIEQVEVLRGPQGTTQGRNAIGGAIIINSATPKLGEFEVKARGSYAELDTWQAAGAVNIPIGDNVAIRFSADQRKSDGYVYNPTRDEDYDQRDSLTLRGKILFEPAVDFSALLTVNYTDSQGGEDLIIYSDFPDERVNFSADPASEGSEHLINTLKLDYNFNDDFSITSLTTYYDHDYNRLEDFDGTPADLGLIDRIQNDENFTQEVRLTYDNGHAIRAIIGGYYGHFNSDVVDDTTVPTAFVDPRLPAGTFLQSRTIDNSEENYAFFGEAEWDVTQSLTLIAGLRYDHETRDTTTLSQTIANAANPAFQAFLDATVARLAPDQTLTTGASYDEFLPKLGARYKLAEHVILGFTAQKAYRAGGTAISTVTQTISEYDPEYSWTYEGSLRASTADQRFTFNANVFYTDWKDQIVNRLIAPNIPQDFEVVNAGSSRIYGAEFQIEARPDEHFTVFAGLGLLDTKFSNYETDNAEFTGNAFSFAPDISVSAGFDWRHPSGFRLSGDVNLSDKYYSSTENDPDRVAIVNGQAQCWRV